MSASDEESQVGKTSVELDVSYICPMMCVPPTTKPGRCPVCGMELVPAAAGAGESSTTIQIDPRSRRVAGIETVAATTETFHRNIRSVGQITYDETRLKTLSAYIDGRVEELYADYTGVHVDSGETLALLYSPDLYSAQVEYVKTLEFASTSKPSNERVAVANERMQKVHANDLLNWV
ncbi:MAG: efflux RND transporter periplasmic adaptor subunit [Pirellulaceae bacterium]